MKRKNDGACLCLCKRKEVWAFWLMVIVSTLTTWYVTGNLLDSDASSEMVLAKHWLETGRILSRDWFYGSELRIVHMQLVFAPLMLIFHDWHVVRFLGTMILQGIYLLSFAFLTRQARLDRKYFYLGGVFLLLPVSVSYGRIVLYHCHYMPNMILSFLMIGLMLGFTREVDWKAPGTYIRLGCLAALSFLGGLNSVRQLMITHAPILMGIVLLCLMEDRHTQTADQAALLRGTNLQALLCGLFAAACSYVGFKCNGAIVKSGVMSMADWGGTRIDLLEGGRLDDLFYSFFHQFGFRDDIPLLSLNGILSCGALVAGVYLLWIAGKRLWEYRKGCDMADALIHIYFLLYAATMLLILLLLSGESGTAYYYPLYLSLCYPWAVPLLVANLRETVKSGHPLHVRRLFSWITMFVLIISGLVNLTFFNGKDWFPQKYEGLTFQKKDQVAYLSDYVDYLQENGYDVGYAIHWECNIVTEMTDGAIPMINVFCDPQGQGNLSYYDCLTTLWIREAPAQKPFLLLDNAFRSAFEQSDSYQYCKLVRDDVAYSLYDITDIDAFIALLYA